MHQSLDDPPQEENALLCNLQGMTTQYLGYHETSSIDKIQAMLPNRFDDVCRSDWADAEPYKDHHSDLGCEGDESTKSCVLCNAVMLAKTLGWDWHLKATMQHFAKRLKTPASIVLALLKHPAIFRHDPDRQDWLHELEIMLANDRSATHCLGPGASGQGRCKLRMQK